MNDEKTLIGPSAGKSLTTGPTCSLIGPSAGKSVGVVHPLAARAEPVSGEFNGNSLCTDPSRIAKREHGAQS